MFYQLHTEIDMLLIEHNPIFLNTNFLADDYLAACYEKINQYGVTKRALDMLVAYFSIHSLVVEQ